MHSFDEPRLVALLKTLPLSARVTFAAACAQRLRPYFGYPQEPPIPPELDAALAALSTAPSGPPGSLQLAVEKCRSILDVDDDAVAAIVYGLEAYEADGARAAATKLGIDKWPMLSGSTLRR